VGDEPVKIDLQTPQALRVGLENQVNELVVRKYLTKVTVEEIPEQTQRASK
jgi:hypothetical protein